MAKVTASGFSISGLLDTRTQTQSKYPIVEIPVSDISDHPANVAYSMDESGIAHLAKSIREDGLTDLPLVRKLDDGSWQMLSGHRRKAAYTLLAKEEPAYEKIPCRVVTDISDDQSVVLLHTANYFVRSLSIAERAAASRALGTEVERMRAENPSLTGMRTEDIKAAIISEQTGRKVSGKSIQRQESLARKIEEDLTDEWRRAALNDELSDEAIRVLASVDSTEQVAIYEQWEGPSMGKRETTKFIKELTAPPQPEEQKTTPAEGSPKLNTALRALQRYANSTAFDPENDPKLLGEIEALCADIRRRNV